MEPAPFPAWLRNMLAPDLRRSMLSVDGHSIHVMESGPADGRPVLCLHGNPTWGFLYRKVAHALRGDPLRIITPDLVGLGFSSKPEAKAHVLEDHGLWIANVVELLDLRDAIFVGQDWGGPIGLRAFAEHPERLAGMVILNTVVSPPRPGFRPTAFHRFSRLPLASDLVFRWMGFPQNAMGFAQGDRKSITGAVRRAYMLPLQNRQDRAAPLALARMVPNSASHPSIAALERCRELYESHPGPVSIVWGDRDPVLGSARNWVAKLRPDAEVTRTQAGHFLQEEVPGPIAEAIRSVHRRIG